MTLKQNHPSQSVFASDMRRKHAGFNVYGCAPPHTKMGEIESYVSNSHIGFDPDYECH